ncbi:MAG TPA: LacI family DNA-binding transcriptional regulator [Lachnospiraceae bacterium]|jgi:LacI family transcriptional regulator|nr:LacI family DNA-binding transcriptional regulator [Lachnospiraceae bacterium]
MISMKDIAARCGVSVATVSKALNNHDDIGAATKKQVREVAKELGYFPNSSARALKTRRTYNIGVLFVDEGQSGLTHDYFAHVLDSFKVTAEQNGFDITFINCNGQRGGMSYLEHSLYRGVDGVVIACVDFYDPDVLELIHSELPVVTIDHVFDYRIAVVSDNIKGMHDLLQYVYENGHRKVAYIHGDDTSVTQNRLGSFYRTLEEFGVKVPDDYVKASFYRNPERAAELTKELLELKDPPTCIIYPDDYSCIGGINAIKEKKLKVPRDVSVAGYDGTYVAQIMEPKLTTVMQDTKEIGRVAAERLIRLIENPKTTLIEKIVIEGSFLKGNSVGTAQS